MSIAFLISWMCLGLGFNGKISCIKRRKDKKSFAFTPLARVIHIRVHLYTRTPARGRNQLTLGSKFDILVS